MGHVRFGRYIVSEATIPRLDQYALTSDCDWINHGWLAECAISIDGRRETVYTDPIMRKHLNFYYVPASAHDLLAETLPDHIWLPVDLPVVSNLLADGWMPLYRGPRSIWLSRDASDPLPGNLEGSERRCFPGRKASEVTEGTEKRITTETRRKLAAGGPRCAPGQRPAPTRTRLRTFARAT